MSNATFAPTITQKLLPHGHRAHPEGRGWEGIVIHCMGEEINDRGTIYSAWDFLKHLKLSAHMLANRDGSLTRAVPLKRQAFHAGESAWDHRTDLNRWFLGIELLVPGAHNMTTLAATLKTGDPFSTAQYKAAAWWVARQIRVYKIKLQNIPGHNHVSPGRKIDPGPHFDWDRLYELVVKFRKAGA